MTDTKPAMVDLTPAAQASAGRVLPQDEYNATLVSNVHPNGWTNPEPRGRYNLVVVGAGTAGLVSAAGAAGLGAKVALIERHLLGGDCLNVGCVPSKCVISSSRLIADSREATNFGIRLPPGIAADFSAVMERMRRLRAQISRHDSAQRFRDELGVDVFLGNACFTGADRIEVDGKALRFKRAVIATGARAVQPPVEGLATAGFLTNETVFSLTEQPRRLAVLGAGPIGCELAQAFQRLGSAVTIIEMGQTFLPREDPDATQILADVFRREGIDVRLNTALRQVTSSKGQKFLHLESGGQRDVLAVDEILLGVGRVPNVEDLGLDAARVEHTASGVHVNDFLQTSNPLIYAAGDVCIPYKFTHTADATARIVIQNALFLGRKRVSGLTVPWCTYTAPEVAHVGMDERSAGDKGIAVDTFKIPFAEVDRAIVEGEEDGFVKIHVKKGTDQILGATIVASHAGEMISEITLAMVTKVGLGALTGVIHPYPTQAEAIRKAADAYNRTRLTPFVKRLFSGWLRWIR